MVAELSVHLKNEEKKQVHKHLVYDTFTCSIDDDVIKNIVDTAVKEFNDEVDDIQIKIKMTVK